MIKSRKNVSLQFPSIELLIERARDAGSCWILLNRLLRRMLSVCEKWGFQKEFERRRSSSHYTFDLVEDLSRWKVWLGRFEYVEEYWILLTCMEFFANFVLHEEFVRRDAVGKADRSNGLQSNATESELFGQKRSLTFLWLLSSNEISEYSRPRS